MAKLPTIVSSIPRDLRMFLERVREAFNATGDDALVTVRSLETYGLVTSAGGQVVPLAQNGAYSTPPAPRNLSAGGALANIILSWDEPTYLGHAYTEVWAAQELPGGGAPDIGEAVLIGMAPGSVYAHNIGSGATRWYWVRFVNIADEVGPYNAVEGVQGSTGQDPAYLLELLTGQLTESQLYQTLGDRIDLIDADATVVGSVAYRVAQEAATRAAEISAEATARANALAAEAAARGTAITAEETARVAADDALASQITTLTATVSGNTAAIQAEETARVTADSALSSQITTLATTVSGNTAAISTEETARTSADNALASSITSLSSALTTTQDDVAGNATAINTLDTRVTTAEGGITTNANEITSLDTRLTTAEGSITGNASALTTLDTRVTTAEGGITTNANEITSLDTRLTTAEGSITGNASALTTLDTRVTTAEGSVSSVASSVTTLQSTVNSNTSAIQTEATTRASETGDLFAQYTVKVDVNGYVAGYGLASTAVDGIPTSEFIVRADTFAIASPSGPGVAPYEPFIVRTTATTINGETVPVGVYIRDAAIQNGSISTAKIGDLAVDTAKIADASITTAKIGLAQITQALIADAAIDTARIEDAAITNAKIEDASITNAKIEDATIDIAKIDTATITNLSSINADMGTITAGKMQSSDGLFVIDLDNKTISIET